MRFFYPISLSYRHGWYLEEFVGSLSDRMKITYNSHKPFLSYSNKFHVQIPHVLKAY